MRRICVITLLMAFATGANAEERCPNKTCESTWMQWFANGATAFMIEQYAATKIPQLAQLNTWVATTLMAQYAARFGGASGVTAGSSLMTKID